MSATLSPGNYMQVAWVIDKSKTRRQAWLKARIKAVEECNSTRVLALENLNYRAKIIYAGNRKTVELMYDNNGAKLVHEVATHTSIRRHSNNWVFSSKGTCSYCINMDMHLRAKHLKKNFFPRQFAKIDARATRNFNQEHTCTQTHRRLVKRAGVNGREALSFTLLYSASYFLLCSFQNWTHETGSWFLENILILDLLKELSSRRRRFSSAENGSEGYVTSFSSVNTRWSMEWFGHFTKEVYYRSKNDLPMEFSFIPSHDRIIPL